ncbi:cation/H(+) antiporter 15-like isoform X1 [Papaver somniferum]|uniref:cation/H(+) antiporter 15-like isoform X1 n=2 Tax=Papaver somniferum TaxID=3469 RepID=UPI000E700722|nr:cation/H(+) antiporter 15-like isoform X1 [Papaver somniferum]
MSKMIAYRMCTVPGIVGSDKGGLFYEHSEDFKSFGPLPSICLQISILSFVPHLMHMALSRFHQPLLVSQILGGILASPWVLSSLSIKVSSHMSVGINYFLFPLNGFQVVDMLAHFSSMFFIFKVGVQMDPKILKKAGRRPYIIGFFCMLCSYVAGLQISHRLPKNDIPALKLLHKSSDRVVDLFGSISFPVIAYVLDDLKILNSDLGISAIHISMVADFLHLALKFFSFLRQILRGANHAYALPAVLILLGTVIYIFFIMRPAALWIVKNTPEGRPVDDIYITLIMISVLLCGLASEYCGLNGTVGVFLLGLAIPDGPPLGSALVQKLRIVSVFFMPLHMGIVGYKTNIHLVTFGYLWRVLLVIVGCTLGKIIGLFIPAVLLGASPRDSLLLGLIMNLKGIVEVSQLNTWLDSVNTKEIFSASNTIMVLALVVLVAVITPAVKYLYDPSSKYSTYKGRSILQSNENNSDFRVLVCVHTQDDVPGIIRIIEASNPTKLHPLTIYLLHLVELVGRASPLLISHTLKERASTSNPTKSERIINVFQQFQNQYQNLVSVHPFTTISPYASMHNDICTMSVDKRAALVIFPFCRQDAISLRDDLARPIISDHAIKTLLQNLLRNTPCSVGILVDGSNLQTKSTCFLPDTPYRVVVLFFGGPDDREALAFAMNMIHHPYVFVTLVRFYGPASLSSEGVIDYHNESVRIDIGRNMFLDDELVDHFRVNTMHDETLIYKEVGVKDGAETIWAVRSLHQDFDLMLVGRQQISDSKIISELNENWDECGELGAVGDLVTSPDYAAEGSILIIHRRRDIT